MIHLDSHGVLVTWGWGRRRRRPAASASASSGSADWPASEPAWLLVGTFSCCRGGLRFEPPAPCPQSWSPDPASLTGSAWYTAEDSRLIKHTLIRVKEVHLKKKKKRLLGVSTFLVVKETVRQSEAKIKSLKQKTFLIICVGEFWE